MFRSKRLLVLALALGLSQSAIAADDGEPGTVPATAFGMAPVSEQALAARRGGAETGNDMDLSGVVSNNHASDLVTGQNMVTDGSLTGNAGFATVVQNSGNNVLIQNATIINLQVH